MTLNGDPRVNLIVVHPPSIINSILFKLSLRSGIFEKGTLLKKCSATFSPKNPSECRIRFMKFVKVNVIIIRDVRVATKRPSDAYNPSSVLLACRNPVRG